MRCCSHFHPLCISVKGQVTFMYYNITPLLGNEILKHHYRFPFVKTYIPQPRTTLVSNACILFFDSAVSQKKKFECTYQSPWFSVQLSLKRLGLRGVRSFEQIEIEAFMSLHSLYEQSVWRCNYFLKINSKSNSASIVQIKKILWDLLDLQACNRERGFKSRSPELWKSWAGKIWPGES